MVYNYLTSPVLTFFTRLLAIFDASMINLALICSYRMTQLLTRWSMCVETLLSLNYCSN